jgi:hypothetical protein
VGVTYRTNTTIGEILPSIVWNLCFGIWKILFRLGWRTLHSDVDNTRFKTDSKIGCACDVYPSFDRTDLFSATNAKDIHVNVYAWVGIACRTDLTVVKLLSNFGIW